MAKKRLSMRRRVAQALWLLDHCHYSWGYVNAKGESERAEIKRRCWSALALSIARAMCALRLQGPLTGKEGLCVWCTRIAGIRADSARAAAPGDAIHSPRGEGAGEHPGPLGRPGAAERVGPVFVKYCPYHDAGTGLLRAASGDSEIFR